MTEAKPISETLPAVMAAATAATDSKQPATKTFSDLNLWVLDNLPARLNDRMLAEVEAIASCPLPALPACGDDHFVKCMRAMAIMPRKADDEIGGKLRLALYRRHLGHHSTEAMSYLCDQALQRCKFFPSIHECLEILQGWTRNDEMTRAQATARSRARLEIQQRFDETIRALAAHELDQAAIDALPQRWKLIAAEKCYLWHRPDGSFEVRGKNRVAP